MLCNKPPARIPRKGGGGLKWSTQRHYRLIVGGTIVGARGRDWGNQKWSSHLAHGGYYEPLLLSAIPAISKFRGERPLVLATWGTTMILRACPFVEISVLKPRSVAIVETFCFEELSLRLLRNIVAGGTTMEWLASITTTTTQQLFITSFNMFYGVSSRWSFFLPRFWLVLPQTFLNGY